MSRLDGLKNVWRAQQAITGGLKEAMMSGAMSPYHYVKPILKVAARVGDPPVGSSPHRVVYSRGQTRLLHYEPSERRFRTPILFVYSLINRYYILDFLPGRSLIEFMRDAGYDVYVIDWGRPGPTEQRMTWDDYLGGHLKAAVQWTRRFSGADDLTLYGYCMGGTMALAYAALYPMGIRNFVAQGTPVDFHDDGVFHQWTHPRRFNVDALVDAWGNVPVSLMETGFSMMAPVQRMTKWLDVYRRIDDPEFVTTFLAMEHWASDNIPFPGEVYRQYIKDCYQSNHFCQGKMKIGARRVELGRIKVPLLNIIAENDTIAPPCSSEVLNGLVGSEDTETFRFQAGHIGLSTSSKGRRLFWPKIAEWIGQRSAPFREDD